MNVVFKYFNNIFQQNLNMIIIFLFANEIILNVIHLYLCIILKR